MLSGNQNHKLELKWRSWTHKTFDEIRSGLLAKPRLLCSLTKAKRWREIKRKGSRRDKASLQQARSLVVRLTGSFVVSTVSKVKAVRKRGRQKPSGTVEVKVWTYASLR